ACGSSRWVAFLARAERTQSSPVSRGSADFKTLPASVRRADGGSHSARPPVGPDSGSIVRAAGADRWRRRKYRALSQSRIEPGAPFDAAVFDGLDRSKSLSERQPGGARAARVRRAVVASTPPRQGAGTAFGIASMY